MKSSVRTKYHTFKFLLTLAPITPTDCVKHIYPHAIIVGFLLYPLHQQRRRLHPPMQVESSQLRAVPQDTILCTYITCTHLLLTVCAWVLGLIEHHRSSLKLANIRHHRLSYQTKQGCGSKTNECMELGKGLFYYL